MWNILIFKREAASQENTASPKTYTQKGMVAVELLENLKAEKLRIDHWRDKEATRDAVQIAISNFLWCDETGLPVESYTEDDEKEKVEEVFCHVFRVYPTAPSPFYEVAYS